ncbi:MAG: aminotransferase [Rhodopirellula sp.]|nr:aminotransferase [Rhodopirellula sp.]
MSTRPRIYLDHAATSWPKSAAVIDAMHDYVQGCGAAAGRGAYHAAAEADGIVSTVRRDVAALIHAADSGCISFHSNGTTALNAAIHGLLRAGDHVVASAAEHNSVLRPLHDLREQQKIQLTIVPVDRQGVVDAANLLAAVTSATKLVALTHASNVTGAIQPVEAVAEGMRHCSGKLLVDAAQTFGIREIDVSIGIDLLAAPGHKASGGPLGTAFLYVEPEIHDEILPLFQGGTGSRSESLAMPASMPAKMEAGNLNVHALAGWAAALRELREVGVERRKETSLELSRLMHEGLALLPHVRVLGKPEALPTASIMIDDLSPADAAAILDAEFGVETRAGWHCAALIHGYLGSESEGTLRISAGHTTTAEEIAKAVASIGQVVRTLHSH